MTRLLRRYLRTVCDLEEDRHTPAPGVARVFHQRLKTAPQFSIRRFHRNLNDYGFGVTLIKTLSAFCSPVFEARTYQLYRADLRLVQLPAAADPAFVFRLILPEERHLVRQIEEMEEWLAGKLVQRIRTGSICLVALDGDRVAAFNLANFKTISLPVVRYQRLLQPGTAFSEQITVHRDYRGRGLGSKLRYEIFRLVRDQGKRYFYGGTDVQNKANLALCQSVGLRVLAEVRFRKFLWFETTTVHRACSRAPNGC